MGLGGISIWQLLVVLVIVVLIFGTKRLKGLGKDLGGAVKGFKDAVVDESEESEKNLDNPDLQKTTAEKTDQELEQEKDKDAESQKVN